MSSNTLSATRNRWLALAILCAGMLMIILDGSIVTVALPSIQRDLHFAPADLSWTVNAYLVAFGGLLLLAGRLGDLLGRKRMFVAGLAVFTVSSLLCGLSIDQGMLIAARFVQGIGAAMTASVSLGMIVMLFPDAGERAKAIGAFSFTGSAGASIGQVLGGVLTQALSWHWIFLINLPIGIVAILSAVRILESDPTMKSPGRRSPDALGATLVTAGLMLGVYTIVETSRYPWLSPHTLGLGAVSVLLVVAFVVRQAKAANPLLPLRIFRSPNVAAANAIQALIVSAMFAFQVLVALYMQQVLGYGAATTGLAMLPAAVAIGTLSLGFSARLNVRFGHRRVLLAGLVLLASALTLLSRIPVTANYGLDLLPVMLLVGGFGLAAPAVMALGMSGAAPTDAGVVSGMFNTAQQIGGALGVAVLSTLAAARTHHLTTTGASTAKALTGGFHLAFTIGAALLVVAMLIAATVLRPIDAPTAEQPSADDNAPSPAASAT